MSNSRRGTKRVCPDCGVRFYDMDRTPIVCAGCHAEFSAERFDKPRRSRPAETPAPRPPPTETPADENPVAAAAVAKQGGGSADKEVDATAADIEPAADPAADGDADPDADGDEEDGFIEDASELGKDEDDVAEVIGNVERPAENQER